MFFLCGLFGLCVSQLLCADLLRVDRTVSVVVFNFGYVRRAGDEVEYYVSIMCFGCVGGLTLDNGKIPPTTKINRKTKPKMNKKKYLANKNKNSKT